MPLGIEVTMVPAAKLPPVLAQCLFARPSIPAVAVVAVVVVVVVVVMPMMPAALIVGNQPEEIPGPKPPLAVGE